MSSGPWDMPMNARAPRPWAAVLGVLGVVNYALLSMLGVISLMSWIGNWGESQNGFSGTGLAASGGIVTFAALTAIAKGFRWWQAEWIALWFLMSSLVVLSVLESFGPGWPEWVLAELIFLSGCAHRTVSLYLFARQARWGIDNRHLIPLALRRPRTDG